MVLEVLPHLHKTRVARFVLAELFLDADVGNWWLAVLLGHWNEVRAPTGGSVRLLGGGILDVVSEPAGQERAVGQGNTQLKRAIRQSEDVLPGQGVKHYSIGALTIRIGCWGFLYRDPKGTLLVRPPTPITSANQMPF